MVVGLVGTNDVMLTNPCVRVTVYVGGPSQEDLIELRLECFGLSPELSTSTPSFRV